MCESVHECVCPYQVSSECMCSHTCVRVHIHVCMSVFDEREF